MPQPRERPRRMNTRRSVRLEKEAAASEKKESFAPPPPQKLTHALEEKQAWKIENQSAHNKNILGLLNSGNMKILQMLPGVGPKSAIIIHTQRGFKVD